MKSKTFVPTILTVIFFIALCTLGTWQLFRLEVKRDIIEQLEKNHAKEFEEVSCRTLKHELQNDWRYKKITISGHLEDSIAYLYSQGPKSYVQEHKLKKYPQGYNLIYKFKCTDGEEILLDYGWVKTEDKKSFYTGAPMKIHGWLMPTDHTKKFAENDKDNSNIWFWVDVQRISEKMGIKYQDPKYFYVLKAYKAQEYPAGRNLDKSLIRNDHLLYAITWYSLAIVAVGVYYFYMKSNSRK